MKKSFKERVLRVVSQIPKGKTCSYKQVAEMVGSPGAARAVGTIMKYNRDKNIPCHRVIRSDGTIGDYSGLQGQKGKKGKEALLKREGAIG